MTDTTDVAPPDRSPHRGHGRTSDRVRFLLRGLGQTLITLAVVVALFIVYEVWVTNWQSERENHQLRQRLEKKWLTLPDSGPLRVPVGDALGVLYIPHLGKDFAWAVVEGGRVPGQDALGKGP